MQHCQALFARAFVRPCTASRCVRSMATAPAPQFNADRSVFCVEFAGSMPWAPSPSPSVWRRRVALEGPAEAGRVTSVVRYDPDSAFHEHGHPDGEEILVLDGAWQDANGDHPTGTYMLNPEGFRHAPSSKHGCVLFVKLRQLGGAGREHCRLLTSDMEWADTAVDGVRVKWLHNKPELHPDTMRLEQWAPDVRVRLDTSAAVTEVFVVSGSVTVVHDADDVEAPTWTWMRLPVGYGATFVPSQTTVVYVKAGEWLPDTPVAA